MISNKRKKIKLELASLCIKSGYQPSFTLRVTRHVNVVKGPPQRKEYSRSSHTGCSGSRMTAICLTPDVAFTQINVCRRIEHSEAQHTQKEGAQEEERLSPEKSSCPLLLISQGTSGSFPSADLLR